MIVKRAFGFAKTRYLEIAKDRRHVPMLFISASWLMRARAVTIAR